MNNLRKRIRLFLLVAMGVCFVLVIALGFFRKKPSRKGEVNENVGPGVSEGRDIHVTRDRWKIWLKNAKLKDMGQTALCNDVKLAYHSDDGREVMLTGDKGQWDQKTMDVEVEGNVVVVATGGYTLKTARAEYHSAEKLIIGHDDVDITGPGFEVTGKSMRVELDPQLFLLDKDVVARIDRRRAAPKVGG